MVLRPHEPQRWQRTRFGLLVPGVRHGPTLPCWERLWAAPAYRSTNSPASGGDTIVYSAPAGLADNDILLAQTYFEPSGVDPSAPAGFAKLLRIDSASFSQHLWWKRAASEAGTYSFTRTGGTFSSGHLHAFSGAITTGNPWDAQGVGDIGTSASALAASITTTVADTLMLYLEQNFDGFTVTTDPVGMTLRVNVAAGYLATQVLASSGATGTRTATITSNPWGCVLVALKPPTADEPVLKPSMTHGAIGVLMVQ